MYISPFITVDIKGFAIYIVIYIPYFKPVVRRIIDLVVTEKDDETVTLTWTSPVTYGLGGEGKY